MTHNQAHRPSDLEDEQVPPRPTVGHDSPQPLGSTDGVDFVVSPPAQGIRERVAEAYFQEKPIESVELYRALGVTVFQKLLPWGGNISVRHRAPTLMPTNRTIEGRLQVLEAKTRRIEGVHLGLLALTTALTIAGSLTPEGTALRLLAVTGINVLFNIYPLMLQRYNRLRVHRIMGRIGL